MLWRKKRKRQKTVRAESGSSAPGGDREKEVLEVGAWTDRVKPRRRSFPGPKNVDVPLRVAMERSVYAELLAHARESLDAEVCGVLVGDVCEDDEGLFVHVWAAIRGDSAKAGGAHVTYTQETWTKIHEEMEDQHPEKSIVGWYHSHPGFGVTFSEMDEFIQRNFFSGPTQIALLLDPLGGGEAIGIHGGDGIEYVTRFWVDGRERRAFAPPASAAANAGGHTRARASAPDAVERLEVRVTQLLNAVEEQRILFHRFLIAVGMVVAVGVSSWIGYSIWAGIQRDREPPNVVSYLPVPIQVGDRQVLIGVGILEWRVPRELNAAYLEAEEIRRRERERQEDEDGGQGENAPSAPVPSEHPRNPQR